eukprot:jgi/Tetstr1/422964/TSEL_013742.t1
MMEVYATTAERFFQVAARGPESLALHHLADDGGATSLSYAAVAAAVSHLESRLTPFLARTGSCSGEVAAPAVFGVAIPDGPELAGCPVSHAALLSFARAKNSVHRVTSASRVFLASAHTFDVSLGDVVATLTAGACLCSATRGTVLHRLGWCLQLTSSTHVTTTPSCWALLGAAPLELPALRVVALGGEPTPPALAARWAGHVELLNTYGVTECTVYQTAGRLPPDATVESVRSAGRPLPGVALAVVALAAQGQGEVESAPRLDGSSVLTQGEIGEVVIGGIQPVPFQYGRRGLYSHSAAAAAAGTLRGTLRPPPLNCPCDNVAMVPLDMDVDVDEMEPERAPTLQEVGEGYLNLPEQTRDKFVAVSDNFWDGAGEGADSCRAVSIGPPLASTDGAAVPLPGRLVEEQLVYRTGDLGSITDAGDLVLLGRMDDQVKVNGNRVELAEVEAALGASLLVDAAAAKLDTHKQRLVAFVVLRPEVADELRLAWSGDQPVQQHDGAATALKLAASERLAAAVLPSWVLFVERLPLSANGKVARGELPASVAELANFRHGTLAADMDELEAALAFFWEHELGLPAKSLAPTDDFFLRGGDSLRAMRLGHRLKAVELGRVGGDRLAAGEYGEALGGFAVGRLYEARTLRGYAAYLREAGLAAVVSAAAAALGGAVGGSWPGRPRDCQVQDPLKPATNGRESTLPGTMTASPTKGHSRSPPQETATREKEGQEVAADAPSAGCGESSSVGKGDPPGLRARRRGAEGAASPGEAALLAAAGEGQRALAGALVAAGVAPDCGYSRQRRRTTPLMAAAAAGHADIVADLLALGANPNSIAPDGRLPLHAAAAAAPPPARAGPSAPNAPPPRSVGSGEACAPSDGTASTAPSGGYSGGGACLRLLLEAGAPLRARDQAKQSILHHAARSGNSDALQLALSLWTSTGGDGFMERRAAVVRRADAAAAAVDWPDRWDRTPLHWAVVNGHWGCCEMLLQVGANPHYADIPESCHSRRTSLRKETPFQTAQRMYGSDGGQLGVLMRRSGCWQTQLT